MKKNSTHIITTVAIVIFVTLFIITSCFVKIKSLQKTNNKKIAAICAAPYVVLYQNGILQKHDNMTCYPGCDNEGIFKSCEIAITDNQQIITANGPFNAIKFALTILREFVSEDAYKEVAKAVLAI